MSTPLAIESNQTGLSVAEETSLKTLPVTPIWYGLEPNTYADLGASYTMVARTPINNTRQQNKGVVTDLEAKANFQVDLTQHNLQRLLQGYFFADAYEKPDTLPFNTAQVVITGITAHTFTAAAGLDVFQVGHLVVAKGCGVVGNNGLAKCTVDSATVFTSDKTFTVEAAPPATAKIEAVGFEFAAGDLVATIVAGQLNLATTVASFLTMGLHVGEWIFIGGDDAANQFATTADKGFARIQSIAAKVLTFDLCMSTFVADDGATKTIRIFFGKVIQNAADPTNIKRRSYNVERSLGNDGSGTQSEYVIGSVPGELTINMKEASKVEVDLTFVGLDVESRSGTVGLKIGTRVSAAGESAFNTSLDIVAMYLAVVAPGTMNPTALFGYFSDAKFVINNNITPDKALAVMGAFEVNAGLFAVSATGTAYFTSVAAIDAIRHNYDVCLTTILAKEHAGIVLDIPLLSLGDGANKVEKDKPISVSLTQTAAKNVAGYTCLINFFEYLPTIAMPV
jgi:hypothetical protein